MSKVLILATHTDDAEIGCGGTISRLLREGNEVYCVVFSKALNFTKGGYIPKEDERVNQDAFQEFSESMAELGVKKENLFIFQFPTRYLYSRRQDVLDRMIEIRTKINPDIVFLPGANDFHQDHEVVSREGLRAFKNKTLYGYEYPWNSLVSNNNCFFILEEEDIKKKIRAIEKYKSQQERPYLKDMWFIKNEAKRNGLIVGLEYAEAFETIKEIK